MDKRAALVIIAILLFSSLVSVALFQSYPGTTSRLYAGEVKDNGSSNNVLLNVPFIGQRDMYCSEASAAMILKYYGYSEITQEYVNENIAINFEGMLPSLNGYLDNCSYATLDIEGLKKEIDQDDPVMIRLLIGDYRHTVVVVGYGNNYIYIHDPARGGYQMINPEVLTTYWISKDGGYWAIVMD